MCFELKYLRTSLAILYLVLAGCGGGFSSIDDVIEGSLYDLNSSEMSNLELITVDGSTLQLSKISGNFVRNEGSATLVVPNESGGGERAIANAVPNKKTTSFVTIVPEGNAINGNFGLLGIPYSSATPPTGNYSYIGNAEIFINDGNALYGLSGNSNITFEFDGVNSKITGEVTSLTGTKSFLDLSCRDCPASSVVDIVFPSGSLCNGNRICIEKIDLRNSTLDAPLTSGHILSSDGTFFGTGSNELGAVFSVNDTASGSIEIRGALVGKTD